MPAAASLGSVPLFSMSAATLATSLMATTPSATFTPIMSPALAPEHPAGSSKPQPLMLSSALPPIPTKVVEKILKGDNLDMKELLADNVALLKRIQEVNAGINLQAITSTSKLKEITDPLTLTYCMLSFLAVKVPHPEARQIIAYMQIVIDLARKHPGPGWLSYHALFRQQMNAGGSSRWNELNTSLMATTVLSTQGGENGKFCQSCMATDHVQADCSLLLLDSNLANARQVSGPTRNQPRRPFQSAPYPSQRAPVGEPCQSIQSGDLFYPPVQVWAHLQRLLPG